MKEIYSGISCPMIQKFINKDKEQHRRRPIFSNSAPLQPVQASAPMVHHQIDLVSLENIEDNLHGISYKYVLSVIDVFSRFVWLRALPKKDSKLVAEELYNIYVEYGPPGIIQADQGTEFKGIVANLCNQLNVRIVYGRAHHPQSQGKVCVYNFIK